MAFSLSPPPSLSITHTQVYTNTLTHSLLIFPLCNLCACVRICVCSTVCVRVLECMCACPLRNQGQGPRQGPQRGSLRKLSLTSDFVPTQLMIPTQIWVSLQRMNVHISIIRRALYSSKKARCFRKRALCFRKQALYFCRRDLHFNQP